MNTKTNLLVGIFIFLSCGQSMCMVFDKKKMSAKPPMEREATQQEFFPSIIRKKPIDLEILTKRIKTESYAPTGINTPEETIDFNLAIDPNEEFFIGAGNKIIYFWKTKNVRRKKGVPTGLNDHDLELQKIEERDGTTISTVDPFMPLDVARGEGLIIASVVNFIKASGEKQAQLILRLMGKAKERIRSFCHRITSIALNSNGSNIAIIPEQEKKILIFTNKLDTVHTIDASRTLVAPITCIAFSPDDNTVVAGTANGIMYLHDLPTNTILSHNKQKTKPPVGIDTGEDDIQKIVYAKDGNLVSIASNGVVKIWQIDGHNSKQIKEHYYLETEFGKVRKKFEKATASPDVSTTAHWTINPYPKIIPPNVLASIAVNEPNKRYVLTAENLRNVLTTTQVNGESSTNLRKGHFATVKILHKKNGNLIILAIGTDLQMHCWEFTSFSFSSNKQPERHHSTGSINSKEKTTFSQAPKSAVPYQPLSVDLTQIPVTHLKNSSESDSSTEEEIPIVLDNENLQEPPITLDPSPTHTTKKSSTDSRPLPPNPRKKSQWINYPESPHPASPLPSKGVPQSKVSRLDTLPNIDPKDDSRHVPQSARQRPKPSVSKTFGRPSGSSEKRKHRKERKKSHSHRDISKKRSHSSPALDRKKKMNRKKTFLKRLKSKKKKKDSEKNAHK